MDYRTFQALVEEELRYLAPFDLSDEESGEKDGKLLRKLWRKLER